MLLSSPAVAWEASSSGAVCLLSHTTSEADVTVRHDPRQVQPYGLEIARTASQWEAAPTFAIRFDGPGRLTISTGRHRLSADRTALTVTDSGFGNVLAGIALNHFAIAVLGDQALVIPLTGAAPEVEKFHSCIAAPGV